MDLSTATGLESLARAVAEQLSAERAETDGAPDRVRVVYADGRALVLAANRPRTRITITAALSEQAADHGLSIEPITVTAQPRPRPGETQDRATARHTAAHIRRRLLPQQTAALSHLSPTVEHARTALASALPDRPGEQWAIADLPVHHPHGEDRHCPIAWWHTPAGESRAVAPFLADILRRAGLVTTEPYGSAHVFFAQAPAEQPEARFHVAPAPGRTGWDLVDQLTGASVNTYTDTDRAQGAAGSENREAEAARHAGAASLDLPGLWPDLIDRDEFRSLAVELATAGHMPYGLTDADYIRTPGFLILPGKNPAVTRVARLLEPWGAIRPGVRREATAQEGERFEKDLEDYARVLAAPGRTVDVMEDGVRVTFGPVPTEP
ncbi:hypothetical protein R6V09_29495 [Streptomyces sp. W16]|uniref:hypothetical protein n=1 Tax=Streptomyces sp. W16 TaxID=3076631 RepID=UPI00295BFC56|nr:hypothetical protein [Streptomyces sp. W16]MDV9174231.1 hypothetical protein [Streptomyces sp. W16]